MEANFVDLFAIFADFEGIAPKNLEELKLFERECRKHGKIGTAEWIYNFILSMEFHKMAEWDIGNKTSISRESESR